MNTFTAILTWKGHCSHIAIGSVTTLIARFKGQYGAHLGPTGPRWAPCWPHELCYMGKSINLDSSVSISYVGFEIYNHIQRNWGWESMILVIYKICMLMIRIIVKCVINSSCRDPLNTDTVKRSAQLDQIWCRYIFRICYGNRTWLIYHSATWNKVPLKQKSFH